MNRPARNAILCPNCRKLISEDEERCPFCGIRNPGSRLKNNPLTRGWGSGETLFKAIIYTNIGIYLICLILSPKGIRVSANPLSMLAPDFNVLALLGATGRLLVNPPAGIWTLITANYLHGSLLHIAFNMIALWQISPLIVQLFGPYRYFTIYTLSGVGGFWLSYIAGVPLTIGASASLCGLIGAALYYGKNRGGMFGQIVYRQIGTWALFIILSGFMISAINNWAHIGGMAVGALVAFLMSYNEKKREILIHRLIAGGCMAATILAVLWGVYRALKYLFFA